MTRRVFAAAGLLVSGGLARAQAPQEPRVFATAVDVVAVDVSVVDSQGRPLPDLVLEDFTLTVDGKPRRLVSARFLSQAPSAAAAAMGEKEKQGRSGRFTTNAGAVAGRLVVIAVDQGNIRRGGGRVVLAGAGRLLDRLSPSDRVGLVVFPAGPQLELTTDHAAVRGALRKVVGRAVFSAGNVGLAEALSLDSGNSIEWNEALRRECPESLRATEREICLTEMESGARGLAAQVRQQAVVSVKFLRSLMDGLKAIEGPKTVILVSESLVTETPSEVSALSLAAAAARVNLFVLVPDALSGDASEARALPSSSLDRQLLATGLEILASQSRGALFRVTGGGVFDRIAQELSGYYLLGVEPEGGDRDGKSHKIRVEVRRKGVTVRARREVTFSEAAPVDRKPEEILAAALKAPFLATDLPLRVATYSVRDGQGAKVKVIVSAEIGGGAAPGDLSLAYVLLDGGGRVAASSFQQLDPTAPRSGDAVRYLGGVSVEPGAYTLKLAALDKAGRKGSVEHGVKAQLAAAGDLEAADLMLVEPPSQPGSALLPGVDPTFAGDRIVAYLELYGKSEGVLREAAVNVEVAESEDGPALLAFPARLKDEAHRAAAQAGLPVGALPPGDYWARALVSQGGRRAARIVVPFRRERGGQALSLASVGAHVSPFRKEDVLRPEVVGFFLNRMPVAVPTPAVAKAIDDARRGRFEAVLDDLAASERGDALATSFLRGLALLAKGDGGPASVYLRAAVRASSEFLPAAFYLGACYAVAGQDREAVGAWQTTLIAETDAPVVYLVTADALLRLDDAEGALAILEEAMAAWPEDEAFRRRLGLAYALARRPSEALAILEPYVDRHPDDVEALFLVVRLLIEVHAGAGAPRVDKERLDRYARAYASIGGPQQPLVAAWLRYFGQLQP